MQIAVDAIDRFFALRILPCQRKRAPVELERAYQVAAPLADFRHPADGRKVVGCALENELQLRLGALEIAALDQRSAERDPRG